MADLKMVNDVDSHEMIPTDMWGEVFGDMAAAAVPLVSHFLSEEVSGTNSLVVSAKDDTEITSETVWSMKGPSAPGAIDMKRRLEALDAMGVQRQLIFPTFGLFGMVLATADDAFLSRHFGLDISGMTGLVEVGHALIDGHNRWAMESLKVDPDRIRPVGLVPCAQLDEMMRDTQRLIDGGVKAIWIPTSQPPAGKSPADRALDPFWTLCEEADLVVTLHIGGDQDFLKLCTWNEVPEFTRLFSPSIELPGADIWLFASVAWPVENYLTVMVLGGVFERHPNLRFGVVECGANWVGPLMETLDMWSRVFPAVAKNCGLTMKPSDYIRRNVRVSPFFFEDIDRHLERYPSAVDVLCYGSDYPHTEGGKYSLQKFQEKREPLGGEVVEKFFVTNGELLFPPVNT